MTIDRRTFLKRFGAGVVVLTPAAGTLVACGGDDTAAQNGADGDGASNLDEIMFTSHSLAGSSEVEVFEELMHQYESVEGVHIEGNGVPYNEALNQYILQARSGNLTGVIFLPQGWIPPLVELDALVDLGGAVDADLFTSSSVDSVTYNGAVYALPSTSGAIGMVGNGVLLAQAGVTELPTDIQSFEAALKAIQDLDSDVIPYAAMTAVEQGRDFAFWMRAFGSDVIGEDGTLTLGDEASVEALEWFKSLLDRNLIAPNMNRFDARPLFAQGRVGFYDDADIAPSLIAGETSDDELLEGMVPVPRPRVEGVDLPPQALRWNGGGYAVLKGGDDVIAASTEFATWLTADPEVVLTVFEGTGRAPVLKDALEDERFSSDEWAAEWAAEISAHARPLFELYPESARMEEILGEMVEARMVDAKDAQTALADASAELQEFMGES